MQEVVLRTGKKNGTKMCLENLRTETTDLLFEDLLRSSHLKTNHEIPGPEVRTEFGDDVWS